MCLRAATGPSEATMSERKPCCQESWDEGWFQGFRNAGELLGFSADSHSSFRAAMDERIADAVQGERKRIASWVWTQAAEPLTTWAAGVNDE